MALIAVFYNYMPLTSIRMCSQHAALHIRRRFGSLVFVQVLFFPAILIFRQLGHYRPTCCVFFFFSSCLCWFRARFCHVKRVHVFEAAPRYRRPAVTYRRRFSVLSVNFLLFVSAVIKLASLCTTQLWVQDAIAFSPKHN